MNPKQFRALRESRNLTRKQLAEKFGCSERAITAWERAENPVADWAAERILRELEISLPFEELSALVDIARKQGVSFEELLKESLTNYLHENTPKNLKAAEQASKYKTKPAKP